MSIRGSVPKGGGLPQKSGQRRNPDCPIHDWDGDRWIAAFDTVTREEFEADPELHSLPRADVGCICYMKKTNDGPKPTEQQSITVRGNWKYKKAA